MATFKVGQRVKKVAFRLPGDFTRPAVVQQPIGATGTVMGFEEGQISVLWDHFRSPHWSGEVLNLHYQLSPLTDPGAEQFIARMKKLGNEPSLIPEKEQRLRRILEQAARDNERELRS